MNGSLSLLIAGLGGPVLLSDCGELARPIGRVLRGWRIETRPGLGEPPVISIARTPKGYVRSSPWVEMGEPLANPVDAACDFVVDAMRAFVANSDRLLCLHCAAIDTDAGLVVFPSTYAAGKSTLAMHAAAAGARLFADDVMPLNPAGEGLAPGILPRLRLPLAAETKRVLAGFLKRREGAHSKRFAYYEMKDGELAGLGETRPVAGMVLLERRPAGAAEMAEVGTAEMLKSTILRNFSDRVTGIEVLDRLQALVEGTRRRRLTYSSAEAAVAALRSEFPFPEERRT